jgi:hypothetical protein
MAVARIFMTETLVCRFKASGLVRFLLVFAVCVVAASWRYRPWMPSVFFGDDLFNYHAFVTGDFASSPWKAISGVYSEKYRPIWTFIIYIEYSTFGTNLEYYMIFNLIIHSISATVVFLIALELSGGRYFVATLIVIAVSTARLALYQVTQATGSVEGCAFLAFVLMLYFVVKAVAYGKTTDKWNWLTIAAAVVAMNIHERYIVLGPWLVLIFLVLWRTHTLSFKRSIRLLTVTTLGTVANAAIKAVVFGGEFFVGTGGSHMTFERWRLPSQVSQAVITVLGLNFGPKDQCGILWSDLPIFPGIICSMVMTCTYAYLTVLVLVRLFKIAKTPEELRNPIYLWPVFSAILIGFLLLPPILTIRIEQRWLLEPFVVMLLLTAWAARHVYNNAPVFLATLPALLVCLASVFVDSSIAPYFGNIFFVQYEEATVAVQRGLADATPDSDAEIAIVTRAVDEGALCHWALQDGEFFRLYGGAPRRVACFKNEQAARARPVTGDRHLYALLDGKAGLRLVQIAP